MQAVKKLIYGQTVVSKVPKLTSNRVLVTSRIVGYQFQPLTELPHYTVEDMNETAISAFCLAWMKHVAGFEEATKEATKLKNAIFDHAHPGIRTLASNPLLLTILAQVYWTNTERALPTKRVALFDAAAKAMYEQRKDFWSRANIPSLRLTRALGAVAMYVHSNERRGFVEEGTVRYQLGTVLFDREQVEAVLEAAREVSGFLVARGEGVYGFLHRAVQEYFVAQHLVDNPSQAATNIAERGLDATWREPITLAVGIVSQRRYPNSRRHLTEIFDTLLSAPDPTGDFLPRRELLAVAASQECERIPPETVPVRRIANNLLTVYSKHGVRTKSNVLSSRIHRTFIILHDGEMKEQAEAILCEALTAPEFEHRYAAVDIIIETQWSSLAIVRALVKAWSTYADPAASLLIALDDTFKRHPDYFQSDFLPLKQAVKIEPFLWEKALAERDLKSIIDMLYLPLDSEFMPELINRDSPLTPLLLSVLRQPFSTNTLSDFRERLMPLANQPGTAITRDAALVLSILGDDSWVLPYLANTDNDGNQICPIVISLTLLINPRFDFANSLTKGLSDIHKLTPVLERIFNRARALNPERALARIQAIKQIHTSIFDVFQELDNNLSRALSISQNLISNPGARHKTHSSTKIERSLIRARSFLVLFYRELSQDIVFIDEFNDAYTNVSSLKQARFQHFEFGSSLEPIRTLASALASNIQRIREQVLYTLTVNAGLISSDNKIKDPYDDLLTPIQTYAQWLKETFTSTYTKLGRSDLYIYLRNYDFTRNIKLVLAREPSFIFFQANTGITEIKRDILLARIVWGFDVEITQMFQQALNSFDALQNFLITTIRVSQVWSALIEACMKRWSVEPKSLINSSASYRLTTDTLGSLVTELTSSDNLQRERIQQVLEKKRLASAIGMSTIEEIGKLAYTYEHNSLIGSQLVWSLQEIVQDEPAWIHHWIEQVKTSRGNSWVEVILGTIHRVIPETFEVMLDALPNSSSCVNIALLKSLSWLTRLKRIPKRKLPTARDLLLTWLKQETESEIRCLIIEILGYWYGESNAEYVELLHQLNHLALRI